MPDSPPLTLGYRSNEPARPPQPRCPKCNEMMLQGVTATVYDARRQVHGTLAWLAGDITRGWFGLRFPKGQRFEILTFKCPACGYLENYCPTT